MVHLTYYVTCVGQVLFDVMTRSVYGLSSLQSIPSLVSFTLFDGIMKKGGKSMINKKVDKYLAAQIHKSDVIVRIV